MRRPDRRGPPSAGMLGLLTLVAFMLAGFAILGYLRLAETLGPERCPPSTLRPTYLPWLPEGAPVPEPIVLGRLAPVGEERSAVLAWVEDPQGTGRPGDPLVMLVTAAEPSFPDELADPERPVEVRGRTGALLWRGDEHVAEAVVTWREGPSPCGTLDLHLVDANLDRAAAEEEVVRIAASLR